MNEELICTRIFEMMQPYSDVEETPIAYITIEAGNECAVSADELKKLFDKKKWNTKLSAVDLEFRWRKKADIPDTACNLVKIQYFEEDADPDAHEPDFVSVLIGNYE